LASLFFKQSLFQSVTKACLVPLVFAVYAASTAGRFFFPVVLALLFGWAGDVLLLKIENLRFFRLGLASFLLGHICYIVSMFYFAGSLNIKIFIISLIAAAVTGVFAYFFVRPAKEMKILVIIYETVILFMAVLAIQIFARWSFPFGAFVAAGSLCFVVSDLLLAYHTFHNQNRLLNFIVMLTYISAQFCITFGLAGA
jgi:uncharacterized membrane protein YhhN